MPTASLAIMEIARFIASQPTPEQILVFHASPEVAERAYALIAIERAGTITKPAQKAAAFKRRRNGPPDLTRPQPAGRIRPSASILQGSLYAGL